MCKSYAHKRSLAKICFRDLCTNSLYTGSSVQNLYKRSPWQDLSTSSQKKTSLPRSLHKISLSSKMSTTLQRELPRGLSQRATTARAIWVAQSDERVARAIPKFALHHKKSDLRGPKVTRGSARGLRENVLCETFVKKGRWRSWSAVRVTKFAGHGWDHLEWTLGLNPYPKNPRCGHTEKKHLAIASST